MRVSDSRRSKAMGKINVIRIIFGCCLILYSCEEAADEPVVWEAGFRTLDIPFGNSVLKGAVWYPTHQMEESYVYNTASSGLALTGSVALNAPVASGSWPLLIFSHGFSGGGIGSAEICEGLAREGYVIVAPDHTDAVLTVRIQGQANGTIQDALEYLENNPFGEGLAYQYRIAEIQEVISYMKQQPEWNINPSKIVYAGHSMGGWTVMKAMAEGPRPTAMVLYSMGELNWLFQGQRYFESPFFEAIDFPTAYFYGGQELDEALDANRGNVYAAYAFTFSPSPSYGFLVPQGNHFTYNSQAVAPGAFGQPAQLESILRKTVSFLDKHVKGESVVVGLESGDVSK
jgi:dienelactone hydrolase